MLHSGLRNVHRILMISHGKNHITPRMAARDCVPRL